MKVRFQPLHGQDYVDTPDVKGSFVAGGVRELSEADAALLLTNPNFVDDATGKNPLYTCDGCGAEHREYVLDPIEGAQMPDHCAVCRAKIALANAEAAAEAAKPHAAVEAESSPTAAASQPDPAPSAPESAPSHTDSPEDAKE